MHPPGVHPASYRDPSGYVFIKDGQLFRKINPAYAAEFALLNNSGLYPEMVKERLIIPFEVINDDVIKPAFIPFISYPSEWCFGMLKEAALLTIEIAKHALQHHMILKDASAYNVQWYNGRMIFIDSLSFEKFENKPWIAYRQFCEQFLGPLLLMHHSGEHLSQLFTAWPEGIPIGLVSKWLPRKTKWSVATYLHIHLHAKYAGNKQRNGKEASLNFSESKLASLLQSLENTIQRLKSPSAQTTWKNYYDEASQRLDYLEQKHQIINKWLSHLDIRTALDLGANAGHFSKLLAVNNIAVISVDADSAAIEMLYQHIKAEAINNIVPLVIDLASPTSAGGLNNTERDSFLHRARVDLVLALALIHHLAIGRNIPFMAIAKMFALLGNKLIVEFVPADDEKVKTLMQHKSIGFPLYVLAEFILAFQNYFDILKEQSIGESGRTLFFMQRKSD